MESHTPVFIVASPSPRVGKTLIARVLVEYFCWQDRPVVAFDVNPNDPRLLDYLPIHAKVANIDNIRGEMALFDRLVMNDQVVKVVDVGHTSFDKFFSIARQIDFAKEIQRRHVTPVVLFPADAHNRARMNYAMLGARFPEFVLVPVLNEAVTPVERYRANFPPTPLGGSPIVVPVLPSIVRAVIEKPDFSLVAYAERTSDHTTELNAWIRRMFITFRELELRLLLGELHPLLKHSA